MNDLKNIKIKAPVVKEPKADLRCQMYSWMRYVNVVMAEMKWNGICAFRTGSTTQN
jgi:hypothetical protein